MATSELAGKTVLLTGATDGLGRALAVDLAGGLDLVPRIMGQWGYGPPFPRARSARTAHQCGQRSTGVRLAAITRRTTLRRQAAVGPAEAARVKW
jgi:hypothetical protein